jgi:uncharacterized membrane protein YccF (DUF307 family)
MRIIGNILWHIPFLGFLQAIFAFLFGTLLVLLVITAPIGLGLIQYSKFLLLPYSYDMVSNKDLGTESKNKLWRQYSFVIMILYFPFGVVAAFGAILQIILLCLTIIGIPVAIPLAKSLHVFLNPVGKVCIAHDVASAIALQKGAEKLKKYAEKTAQAQKTEAQADSE